MLWWSGICLSGYHFWGRCQCLSRPYQRRQPIHQPVRPCLSSLAHVVSLLCDGSSPFARQSLTMSRVLRNGAHRYLYTFSSIPIDVCGFQERQPCSLNRLPPMPSLPTGANVDTSTFHLQMRTFRQITKRMQQRYLQHAKERGPTRNRTGVARTVQARFCEEGGIRTGSDNRYTIEPGDLLIAGSILIILPLNK
jgi:hypothetical protein